MVRRKGGGEGEDASHVARRITESTAKGNL